MLVQSHRFAGLLTLVFVVWIASPASPTSSAQTPTDPSSQLESPGAANSDSSFDSFGISKAEEKPAIGKYRFEPQSNREYLVQRARMESEARRNLLQYYQAMGWNYAQPTVDGMAMHPYPRSRRPFFMKPMRPW